MFHLSIFRGGIFERMPAMGKQDTGGGVVENAQLLEEKETRPLTVAEVTFYSSIFCSICPFSFRLNHLRRLLF